MVPARCPARRTWPRRPVKAVRVRRHPAPVGQPGLSAGYRPAVRRGTMRHPAVRRGPVRGDAVLRGPVRRGPVRRRRARHAAVGRDAVRHRPVGYAAIWVPAVRYPRARRSARRRTVGPATRGHAVITGHAAVARDAARRDTVGRDGGPVGIGLAGLDAGVPADGAVAAGAAHRPDGAAVARSRLPRRLPVGLARRHRPPRPSPGSHRRTSRIQGRSRDDPARV